MMSIMHSYLYPKNECWLVTHTFLLQPLSSEPVLCKTLSNL
jgi:hypothetical protein